MDLHISNLRIRAVTSLVATVAALSFITGILNIGVTSINGPLAQYIPVWLQQAAGFTGTLTGFLMLASVLGLRKRLKVGWNLALILSPAAAVQGLIQSSPLSYPLIILSLFAIPALLTHRRDFTEETSLDPAQTASLIALTGTQIYGTVGTLALEDGFNQSLTLLDAFYYSLATSSTVGYGDIVPVTPEAKLFTTTLIVLGPAIFVAAIGSLLAPLIESKLSSRFEKLEEDIAEDIKDSMEE